MMKWNWVWIITLAFNSVFAFSQKGPQIICEPENNQVIQVMLDLNDRTSDIEKINFIPDGDMRPKRFTMDELINDEVILYQQDQYDVVFISCPKCTASKGGELVLRYLYNGFWGTYHKASLYLEKNRGSWGLFSKPLTSSTSKEIASVTLKGNYSFGKLLGIKELRYQYLPSLRKAIKKMLFARG